MGNDITIYQGTSQAVDFFIAADAAGAVPLDLSGYTAALQARTSFGATTTTLAASTEDGKLTITPAEGRVTWHVAPEDTIPVKYANATDAELTLVYDLELYDGSATRKGSMGEITLIREVTR